MSDVGAALLECMDFSNTSSMDWSAVAAVAAAGVDIARGCVSGGGGPCSSSSTVAPPPRLQLSSISPAHRERRKESLQLRKKSLAFFKRASF